MIFRGTLKLTLMLAGLALFIHAMAQKRLIVCQDCSIKTVRLAIDQANDFDTIFIRRGYYPENQLYIRKPLTIIGEAGATLDAQFGDEIIIIRSDHVEIRGLTLVNVGLSYTKDRAAIRMERSAIASWSIIN